MGRDIWLYLVGAKLAQDLGVPVESFAFWQWAGPARALNHSLLSDVSSLMNIGMVLGAAMLASISGQLGQQKLAIWQTIAGRSHWRHSDGHRRAVIFWL